MENKIYDTIIIGAGPAALSASIYASRYFLDHIVVGKTLGGTMANAHKIENYPGIATISGAELAQNMLSQLQNFKTEVRLEEVQEIKKDAEGVFEVKTENAADEPLKTYSIILTIGMQRRILGIPGEKEYTGKGVSYCSTCDAAFFKDKTVAVIGGANAATMAAIHLGEYAKKVYLIYRGDELRGEPAWNQRVIDDEKIEVIFGTNITAIKGNDRVEYVVLDKAHNGKEEIMVDGVFIEIGLVPVTSLAENLGVELTPDGFIDVDIAQRTNVPGVLAAGDITNGSNNFRQIVTAISEGAIAVKTVFDEKIIRTQHEPEKKAKKHISYS